MELIHSGCQKSNICQDGTGTTGVVAKDANNTVILCQCCIAIVIREISSSWWGLWSTFSGKAA